MTRTGARLVLPEGIEPYYEEDGIVLYCGDCREILPRLPEGSFDLVLTDPPYPGFNDDHGRKWSIPDAISWLPLLPECHQFIFWPAIDDFYGDYSAVHIWHKPNGQSEQHYERIFERNGRRTCRVWRIPIINYETLPEWTPHPTQKPLRLILDILARTDEAVILDPFAGSGTTLVAAKMLGRRAIGIEVNPAYCDIIVNRLRQSVLPLHQPAPLVEQLALDGGE